MTSSIAIMGPRSQLSPDILSWQVWWGPQRNQVHVRYLISRWVLVLVSHWVARRERLQKRGIQVTMGAHSIANMTGQMTEWMAPSIGLITDHDDPWSVWSSRRLLVWLVFAGQPKHCKSPQIGLQNTANQPEVTLNDATSDRKSGLCYP